MNKLHITLHIIILILLSSFVSAAVDDDVILALNLDESSGDALDSSGNGRDFTVDANYNQLAKNITFGTAYGFVIADTDFLTRSEDFLDFPAYGDFSICLFINNTDWSIDSATFLSNNDGTNDGIQLYVTSAGNIITFSTMADGAFSTVNHAFDGGDPSNKWIQICVIRNDDGKNLTIIEDNYVKETSAVVAQSAIGSGTDLDIGRRGGYDDRYYNGSLDEIIIWNRSIGAEEIVAHYNYGAALFSEILEVTAPPTIVNPSPEDGVHNDTNVTLNVSHVTTQNDVRYYLYFGTSSTLTEADLYLNNVTRNASEWRSFYTNVSDGLYYWKWKVQNITSGVISTNTTQRNWTLDTVIPTITLGNNNNFSTDNSTIINSYLNNLSINISFFDINLYQTLINITNSTGGSVYNYTNVSITQTTDNISKTIDISGWTLGNYTIQLAATDSHTAKYIPKYDTSKGLNYLRYRTTEGNDIRITSNTLPLAFSTTKLTDRYDFEFNYLFLRKEYKYTITSKNKIDYIEDSDYKAHFVIMGENGGNWMDFENEYLSKKDYTVIKISDYEYQVIIKSKGRKQIKFNSLGGLNTIEVHYLLRLGAVIDVWVYDDNDYPNQIDATATIGTQSANSVANTSGARLVNLTDETTSLTLTSSGYGTEEKAFSITGNYHNLSFNLTPVNAIRLYFYDEKSEALIDGEIFSVYLETTGFSQTYSGINSTANNPYTITGLTSGSYELKASSSNYKERRYVNLNINNVTITTFNIYLINSTDGAEKTFRVTDNGINPLENVIINFTRTINGTGTVIAGEETDYNGQVKLYLDSNYEYRIIFTKSGYNTKIINLEPTDSSYAIILTSEIGEINASLFEGISYRFSPTDSILNNDTTYNFSFTLNSSYWTITNCTLYLKNGTSILNQTSGHNSDSCYLRIELNTNNMTDITSEAVYELNSLYNMTVSKQYRIIYTYEGEFSLKNFLDDLSDFAMAGFNNFTRMIIALIVIFVIVALAARNLGFTNPESLIPLTWALVGFFSYLNWFYLDYTPIPDIIGLRKYIIFILVSLIGGAFFLDKFAR